MVASFIAALALVAVVASAVNEAPNGLAQASAETAKVGAKATKPERETLAATILTTALHSSPEKLMNVLSTWRDHQISNLDPFNGKQVTPKFVKKH
jgi:hypothetical protein